MSDHEFPPILDGTGKGSEVIFGYTFKDGTTGRVVGGITRYLAWDGVVTRIEVDVNTARSESCAAIRKIAAQAAGRRTGIFRLARITPEQGTSIAAAPAARTAPRGAIPAQVRYAMSLCERTDLPGYGNFVRHDRDEFEAMSRREISAWIGMAKDEMGIGGGR